METTELKKANSNQQDVLNGSNDTITAFGYTFKKPPVPGDDVYHPQTEPEVLIQSTTPSYSTSKITTDSPGGKKQGALTPNKFFGQVGSSGGKPFWGFLHSSGGPSGGLDFSVINIPVDVNLVINLEADLTTDDSFPALVINGTTFPGTPTYDKGAKTITFFMQNGWFQAQVGSNSLYLVNNSPKQKGSMNVFSIEIKGIDVPLIGKYYWNPILSASISGKDKVALQHSQQQGVVNTKSETQEFATSIGVSTSGSLPVLMVNVQQQVNTSFSHSSSYKSEISITEKKSMDVTHTYQVTDGAEKQFIQVWQLHLLFVSSEGGKKRSIDEAIDQNDAPLVDRRYSIFPEKEA